MPRKYKEHEIKNYYQFPSSVMQCKIQNRELKCEYPIYDINNGSYCIVVRDAIPKHMTSQLFMECQRDCTLQITNTLFGKPYLQPRVNCVYANSGITRQKYSGTEVPAIPWTDSMRYVRDYVATFGMNPNACLVNGYLTTDHYVDYHRDRELRDGNNTVMTVSLGGSRVFSFMRISDNELSPPIWLHDGDFVMFYGNTNTLYKHSIIKPLYGTDSRPRYSATFRIIDEI